jgi:hypothetical protein
MGQGVTKERAEMLSFPLIRKGLPERGDLFAEDWAQCCDVSAYIFAGVGFALFVYRGHGFTMVVGGLRLRWVWQTNPMAARTGCLKVGEGGKAIVAGKVSIRRGARIAGQKLAAICLAYHARIAAISLI